jgi:acyl carrier protein
MNIRTELLCAMKDLAIDTEHISSETRLREDLEMDSTELVELAVVLEKRLSLEIDDAILGKFSTFGDVEQFLESLASVLVTSNVKGVKTHATHTA